MKFAVLASLIASAAAFAPAKQATKTTSLAAFEDALGAQPPVSFGISFDGVQRFPRPRFSVRASYVSFVSFSICSLASLTPSVC